MRSAALLALLALASCSDEQRSPQRPGARAPWVHQRPADLEPLLAELVDGQLKTIREQGESAASVGRLGLIYEANRQWAGARDAFERARELAPDEPLWAVHEALARASLADHEGAARILREAAPRHPQSAPLQYALGEVLLEEHDLDGAAAAFERTVAAAPTQPEGHFGRGLVELRRERAEEARAAFARALALDAGFRQAWYPLGLALRALGRDAEAAEALERGSETRKRRMRDELNAQLAELAVTRDEVLERTSAQVAAGNAAAAIPKLERLARAHPEDSLVQFNLGVALSRAGRPQEGLAALERARARAPELFALDVNLALVHLALGDQPAAAEASRRALAREGSLAGTHVVHALVCEAAGDIDTALVEREHVVRLEPRNPAARGDLGRTLAVLGRWAEAEQQFRTQLGLAAGDWQAHANLARVLGAQGRGEEARAALADARKHSGGDARSRAELDELEQMLGS